MCSVQCAVSTCIAWVMDTGEVGFQDWVNPSKRGGMEGFFQGLIGLL